MSLHNPTGQILTAFFDSRSEAENAIDRILGEGISRDEITIVEGADASGEKHRKSFFEMLGDLFMPHEDRQTYAEGLRRGGYLVSVPTNAANHDRVRDILDDEGTVDIAAREQSWRAEGWAGTESEYEAVRRDEPALDRSALFEPAPGLSGSGAPQTARFGRRGESPAETRTRSYVFDDLAAEDHLHGTETDALGYDRQSTRTETASEIQRRTEIELEDQRRTEAERLRSGETR
jgi:hypothetical protein